ncbi:hypothetical protein ACFVVQ_12160 [Paenibacillus chitinolyticus]|uniref:phage adaptor protein n=1 Tax=Paenibacillus chitinolyticus TaxID=79263 RepID=UPI0036DEE56E
MTLQDILNEIMELYPHALTQDSVVRKVNDIQNRLYRTYYTQTSVTAFDLIAGLPFYPLGYSASKVVDVVVNGVEYPYLDGKGIGLGCFYTFTADNAIELYPVPDKDQARGLMVFHYLEPYQLTMADLGRSPDFDKDFHKLLIYGTCVEVAEGMRDIDFANAFTVKYNGLLQEFNQAKRVPDYPVIEMVYGGLL